MEKTKLLLLPCTLFIIFSCRSGQDCSQMINDIQKEIEAGNLKTAIYLAGSVKRSCGENSEVSAKADSLAQIAVRIGMDFSVGEEQAMAEIENKIGSFSEEEKSVWEMKGWLEGRIIDGKKMYFKRAVSNLLLLKQFYEQKEDWLRETAEDPEMIFRLKHIEEAFQKSDSQNKPVTPVNIGITYSITVDKDAIPDGEKIRCWLPWPKSNHPRQQKVELLTTSSPEYIIAPDSAIHSTIYMEQLSKKHVPTVFRVSFRYQSNAQYFNIAESDILPYDKTQDSYKKYTSEQLPQIIFTENIKQLADSITGPDDSPAMIVRKIYYWFEENIPWTGALEYSIMPDIPEYVIQNKRGDCGMKNFLFISMLRYKGIPVRWQSGFMVPPDDRDMHDWCEVYYEGAGWIPVDVDYGLQQSGITGIKEFYLSGIDSYRLILNDGVAGPLHPGKQYLRSEPFDFQRGEVEWKGGNLYFDKWEYDMKIDYLK